jgi:hypothetical protein
MASLKNRITLVIFGLILLLSGIFALVFLLRAPVLIVTDAPFIELYGQKRLRKVNREAELALLRRVKPVIIAESAGADVIALAVETAAAKPYCVLVPYRYEEGAARYIEQFPQIPVAVQDGRRDGVLADERLILIKTDRDTDFYRAGLCAGILGSKSDDKILVFKELAMRELDKTAFIQGLHFQGVETAPFYINAVDVNQVKGFSCALIIGAAADYFNVNPKMPVILFSWLDPALTPRDAIILFDDSPHALAVSAVKIAVGKKPERIISSKIIFPKGRIADKHIVRQLKIAVGRILPPVE